MAGRAATNLITEDDGPDGDGPQGHEPQLAANDGLDSGQRDALLPVQGPAIIRAPRQDAPQPEFEIIETDEQGNALDGGFEPEQPEGRLTESEAGQRAVIESPEQQQERANRSTKYPSRRAQKEAQRAARDKNLRENAALKAEIDDTRAQLEQMRQHIAGTVDPRLVELGSMRLQNEVQKFDSLIAEQDARLRQGQAAMSAAMTSQDGEAFNAALQARDAALVARARLDANREALKNAIQQQQQSNGNNVSRETGQPQQFVQRQQTAPAVEDLSPRAKAYARDFQEAFPQFDPDTKDRDSKIVARLDGDVRREGYDPASEDYWDELERRMQREVPDWFGAAPAAQQRQPARREAAPRIQQQQAAPVNQMRRGPAVAGSAEMRSSGKVVVQLSPARKAAMIASGSLGEDGTITNREKFNGQVARYAEFDRANGGAR